VHHDNDRPFEAGYDDGQHSDSKKYANQQSRYHGNRQTYHYQQQQHYLSYARLLATRAQKDPKSKKNIHGAPIKINPLGKIIYLHNCSRCFKQNLQFLQRRIHNKYAADLVTIFGLILKLQLFELKRTFFDMNKFY